MAIGAVNLSGKGRKYLSIFFIGVSCFQACISFGLIAFGLYISIFVAPHLPSEKAVISLIFTVITMYGMELVTYYTVGLRVCRKCHFEAHKKHSRYLLRIWMFTGYSSIINIVVTGTMAAGISNHILRSMHHSMERGISRYLKDLSWKSVIDSLQYKLECCGASGYKDWYEIAWMSTSMFSESSEVVKKYRKSGDRIYIPATPWSCCKLDYPTQCFHDPVQQSQSSLMWEGPEYLALKTIYTRGCLDILQMPIENGFLYFIVSSYVLLVLQILMTLISKILYSSYRNAIIKGNPSGTAPGWIWGTSSDISLENVSEHLIFKQEDTETPKSVNTVGKIRLHAGQDRFSSRRSERSKISKERSKLRNKVSKEHFISKGKSVVRNVVKKLSPVTKYELVKNIDRFIDEETQSEDVRIATEIENTLFLKCQ